MSSSDPVRGAAEIGFQARVSHWECLDCRCRCCRIAVALAWPLFLCAQVADSPPVITRIPPRVQQAQRFLAQRGWPRRTASHRRAGAVLAHSAQSSSTTVANWQPVGPSAVLTPSFGLVAGRVPTLALDPADPTGNRLYLGATGGGVWVTQNAAASDPATIFFTPLTDDISSMQSAIDASISIGALTVQPGGTGVILAGTGDPNDALDSYYGAGILRSTDSGNTWSSIAGTADRQFSFAGEGFAGFAWSTVHPQLVVAAVSQAYEGTLVNAPLSSVSYEGLYYSTDAGATWSLSTIADSGGDVQGPGDILAGVDGNAATAVVWNPVRRLFVAAVRFHGYYQSSDGVTWSRLTAQPGAGLSSTYCPTNAGAIGSTGCPIFRGALAVNPQTGDTFAWTVDLDNQDQGIFQDQCAMSAGACTAALSFGKRWDSTALQANTYQGAATILNGDYNLVLAAVPSNQDTILLVGGNDLWKCSLAAGCVWRNTTNTSTCMSAGVAEYQHALAWNPTNPSEVLIGNDSGLWRSMDAVGETGPQCNAADGAHFQNLNANLGSLAEVADMAQAIDNPYAIMAALGANGTAGVKQTAPTGSAWPVVLGGEGGKVAIGSSGDWFANNAAGVSIYRCSQQAACTPSDFGSAPVVNMNLPGGDGMTMTTPAPFLVDPLDPGQLLIGTCRVWRIPASGSAWTASNAISPIFDAPISSAACNGDALIHSMAAMALQNGSEIVYVGLSGAADGGSMLPGRVLSAVIDGSGTVLRSWQDLTFHPVSNSALSMNAFGMDVSSILVDPSDRSGNTVYVSISGIFEKKQMISTVYRSTDGGAHWVDITANLPPSPANSVAVDPTDPNTVYVALDAGVFSTRQISTCGAPSSSCWTAFGAGLPVSPVVQLGVGSAGSPVLSAATYGRGVWQAPLWTAGETLTTASVSPTALSFSDQPVGSASHALVVTLANSGGATLLPTAVSASGDFSETDNCTGVLVNVGAFCTIQVTFAPTLAGARTGQLTIAANVPYGEATVPLSGNGTAAATLTFTPPSVDFGSVAVGTTSAPLPVTGQNTGSAAVSLTNAIAGPFLVSPNLCSTIAAGGACSLSVVFAPIQAGAASGTLTFSDAAGTQTVALKGTGAAPPTDTFSANSLAFPSTVVGQTSSPLTVTISNNGDVALTLVSLSVSGPFQAANGCGTTQTGKASCAIDVTYSPTQVGAQSGVLTVVDALGTRTVSLSGVGISPAVLAVSPSSLVFAAQQVGRSSSPQTLVVSNAGGASMANVGFQIVGASAASFSTGATTCGATLASGSSCTVQVVFAPAASGGNVATLAVSSSTLGVAAVQVALSGTGTNAAGLNVSPAQLAFPPTVVGEASATQTVMVSNAGSFAANALSFTIGPPFSVTQNTCGSSLAAAASCVLGIAFTPAAVGVASGSLTISSASIAAPAQVALSGTGGSAAGMQVAPGAIAFPATGVGQSSSATTVTVSNNGTLGTLNHLALTVSAGFQLTQDTCGSALAPQAACTVGVVFAPSSSGPQTGALAVTSSASTLVTAVALSGTGFDFAVSPSGSASQSIASGQTATYTLTLAPAAGQGGSFTYGCGSLPAYAACTFSPASETVAAGGTGNVTVQIATGPAARGFLAPFSWGRAAPFLCGLLLPLAWGRKRRLMGIVVAMVFGVLVSGCAGAGFSHSNGGGGGGSATTAPGTYQIPVTVTSMGVQHSVMLTLVVD